MQASFKCSKTLFNRRLLAGLLKGTSKKLCAALYLVLGTWSMGRSNRMVKGVKYLFLHIFHHWTDRKALWRMPAVVRFWDWKGKKLPRKSLPASNKYHYKMFLQVRGKFRSPGACRSSWGMEAKIITFESSEDKKQNFKNIRNWSS